MTLWVDAQFSPIIATWIRETFSVEARSMKDLGLRDATDRQIFLAAKKIQAIIITKDSDFLNLANQLGTPTQVIWITCGNTSNAALKDVLSKNLPHALQLLGMGEPVVEIADQW